MPDVARIGAVRPRRHGDQQRQHPEPEEAIKRRIDGVLNRMPNQKTLSAGRFDGEMLFVGLACLAFAVPLALWLRQWRPVQGPDVRVMCPGCGYDMAGLREPRCPECGREYTLDELINGQPR